MIVAFIVHTITVLASELFATNAFYSQKISKKADFHNLGCIFQLKQLEIHMIECNLQDYHNNRFNSQ